MPKIKQLFRRVGIARRVVSQDPTGADADDFAGGTTSYVRTTPTTSAVGGAPAGSTFSGSVADALDRILYAYQAPSFSAFSFPAATMEVGATLAAGAKSFTWSVVNGANVAAGSISISEITDGPVTLGSSLANDGSESLAISGAITKTVPASHVWRITGTNTQGGSFLRNFVLNWYWRVYYGESVSASLNEVGVEGLRASTLAAGANGTYAMLGGGYKYIAYPTSMGLKATFKDPSTGFDIDMQPAVTVSVTNAFGQVTDYYVHRTTNILGGAINIAVS